MCYWRPPTRAVLVNLHAAQDEVAQLETRVAQQEALVAQCCSDPFETQAVQGAALRPCWCEGLLPAGSLPRAVAMTHIRQPVGGGSPPLIVLIKHELPWIQTHEGVGLLPWGLPSCPPCLQTAWKLHKMLQVAPIKLFD